MLPTFLVIGAMKAGTTSLHLYLANHPQIFMSEPKELDFFIEGKNWGHGVGWYEERFAGARNARAAGESSTNYTKYPRHRGVPARIRSVIPDARLVYVLRHPIDRMVSQYWHSVAHYGERRPLAIALLENPQLLAYSDYAAQIEQYLDHFERGRLLVVTAEDLKRRTTETLRTIHAFVGVDPSFTPANVGTKAHQTQHMRAPHLLGRRFPGLRSWVDRRSGPVRAVLGPLTSRPLGTRSEAVPPDVRDRLAEILRPRVERLRSYLGPDFEGWDLL